MEGAAMEVEQTQAGATGAKALDRTSARASSTLIQANVSTAELQAALPIRPATRVVVPFLLHAPQARHLRVCGLSCLAVVSSFYMALEFAACRVLLQSLLLTWRQHLSTKHSLDY